MERIASPSLLSPRAPSSSTGRDCFQIGLLALGEGGDSTRGIPTTTTEVCHLQFAGASPHTQPGQEPANILAGGGGARETLAPRGSRRGTQISVTILGPPRLLIAEVLLGGGRNQTDPRLGRAGRGVSSPARSKGGQSRRAAPYSYEVSAGSPTMQGLCVPCRQSQAKAPLSALRR